MLLQFQNISWREPLWIFLSFQPVIFLLIRNFIKNQKSSYYADKKLYPWVSVPSAKIVKKTLKNKNSLYIIAWLLFSIALAGPRWPLNHQNKEKLFGIDIMLVVDHSKSMMAKDIYPNRLRRAKLEIYELLEKAANHKVGITVFSARPHLFVPLTSDHDALKHYLESLEQLTFPTEGSNPVQAIQFANKELLQNKKPSVIILITDGDYTSFTDLQLQTINHSSIPIYVLGIGTVEGDAIQSEDGTWLRYNKKHVISKMNEDNLIKLARYSKGKYSPVYDDSSDWENIFDQGIVHSNSISNIEEKKIIWHELFPYFLIPSIFLFIISLNTFKFTRNSFSTFILLTTSIFLYPEDDLYAFEFGQTNEQAAYRSYQKEQYINAEEHYKKIKGYNGYLGQANSLYRQGYYHKAIKQFMNAVVNAENENQSVVALYNLANSYFRTGQFSLAISTYQDVLHYKPAHKSSLYNLKTSKILKKNIELRLKKQEQSITSSRQGRGPQSASVSAGSEISDNASVSVGESDKLSKQAIPLPKLPNMDNETVKKLILSGLKNIKLAEQDNVINRQKSFNNNSSSLAKTQQHLNTMQDSQHLLWKRLFEMEEGFPAPVDIPKQIPGIKPW